LDFLDSLQKKNLQISNLLKIRPVGAELFHAERRTGRIKLITVFHNFAKAPKNLQFHVILTETAKGQI
jgi:hypothetical protein